MAPVADLSWASRAEVDRNKSALCAQMPQWGIGFGIDKGATGKPFKLSGSGYGCKTEDLKAGEGPQNFGAALLDFKGAL